MTVPNIFGSATSAIPLSQLDQNFATAITLGNTAVYLGNTTTSLGNVTLTNVTISSGNVTLTGSNVSGTANVSTLVVAGNVGIGTNTPAYPLQVSTTSETNIAITSGTASETNIFFGDSGSATIGRITYNNNGDYMRFNVNASERMRIDSAGDVGIGTTTPVTKLEIAGTNNTAWSVTASITGTTMDVTAVTTSGVAVGDLVHGSGVQPYTRVTALGTGTGGIGTYTVSVSQTLASGTVVGCPTYGSTLIRITETDTAVTTGQPTGGLQFYTSDNSTPTAGVGAYVAAVAESSAPDTSLVFGTRDGSGGGIDANERMRIDSSGNLGVGTASPTTILNAYSATSAIVSVDGDTNAIFRATRYSTDANPAQITARKARGTLAAPTTVATSDIAGGVFFQAYGGTNFRSIGRIDGLVQTYTSDTNIAGALAFYTNAGSTDVTERMRIDSNGYLLVNQTSNATSSYVQIKGAQPALSVESTSTGNVNQIIIRNPNGTVGSISTSGSSTAYNTSSDYRLKKDITPMTGVLAKVALLKPVNYKWKVDGSNGEGFIAHELAEVCPDAVTGEKDGEQMQGVDYGKLTPILTAALQEAISKIETLEARIAVLETK